MGVVTAVVADGRIVRHDPNDRSVPWWSVTKTIQAAACLMLAAQGRLALDAPSGFGPFSLRQLLQHTAGVPEYSPLPVYQGAVTRNDTPWSDDELRRRVRAERLLSVPGRAFAYSNLGYLYVRRTIERATGVALETALHELVLAPLGVTNVRVARAPEDLDGTAWGNARRYHPGWVFHGLLVGTPADAAQAMHGIMTAPALREAMCVPRPIHERMPDRPWRSPAYGLGVMMDAATAHGRCMGHTGGGPGSACAVYHFPDVHPPVTTAVFSTTGDAGEVERAAFDLAATRSGGTSARSARPLPARRRRRA